MCELTWSPRFLNQNWQSAAPPAIVPNKNGLISITFFTVCEAAHIYSVILGSMVRSDKLSGASHAKLDQNRNYNKQRWTIIQKIATISKVWWVLYDTKSMT